MTYLTVQLRLYGHFYVSWLSRLNMMTLNCESNDIYMSLKLSHPLLFSYFPCLFLRSLSMFGYIR